MADTSDVTEEAIEHAWRSVKGLLDEADRCGYRLYSSRYQRGEIEFRMSDGVILSKSVTLPFREWFKQRGLRFMLGWRETRWGVIMPSRLIYGLEGDQ
jgi:hypothetical protein